MKTNQDLADKDNEEQESPTSSTPTNASVIKSYVWHKDNCFFVSTIERNSSAMLMPGRYNETMIWEYDWKTAKRGEMLDIIGETSTGSLREHFRICETINRLGVATNREPGSADRV